MWQQPGGWGQQPWPIQQSAYANMAHDQVDWAALAKQWMQFKDVGDTAHSATPPPLPPQVQPAVSVPATQPAGDALSQRSNTWTTKPPPESNWSQPTSDSHAWGSSTANDWTMDVDSQGANNSSQNNRQPAPSQAFDYNHGTTSKTFENSFNSSEPSREIVERPDVTVPPPAPAPVAQYNQGYEYNQQHYHEQQQPQIWLEQTQKLPAADRLPTQPRPHFHDADVTGPPPAVMDAAKRKTLPAWIREGLEKMEKNKARKEEQERLAKERQEARLLREEDMKRAEEEAARTGIPVRSKFEEDEVEDRNTREESEGNPQSTSVSKVQSVSRSPTPEEVYMTPEEREAQLMMKVKLMLTEVLLTVTNEQIESVCRSVYSKCRKEALAGSLCVQLECTLSHLLSGYFIELSQLSNLAHAWLTLNDKWSESSRTVSKKKRPLRRSQSMRTTRTYYVDCVSTRNPLGNPEFSIQFDMRDFKADDISLTTKNGKLIISATHEDKIGKSTSRREFTRSVDLPADIQINMMRSVFSRDGILSITAPIKPPHYDPVTKPIVQSAFSSQQAPLMFNAPFSRHEPLMSSNSFTNQEYAPATSSQSTPAYPTTSQATQPYYSGQTSPKDASSSTSDDTHKSMDYTLPVSGYLPEELEVCVERRKVKVQGKHVENRIGGRKTHNVFTKIFDLPSYVDADDVRCYVKDGHTLHVVAHVGHDIQGLVHFLPVTKK